MAPLHNDKLSVLAIAAVATVIAGSVGLGLCAFDAQSRPDRSLTPGAIASTDRNEICTPGYAKTHREAFGSEDEYRRYVRRMNDFGVPHSDWRLYEMDHLVPICLGGADTEANMWPEGKSEAIEKDRLEVRICRQVCNGSLQLDDAQRYFLGWAR